MKNKNTLLTFAGGILLGLTLALCLGAGENEAAKKDSPPWQVVSYPNGGTGFFDPVTSTIYVYDSELKKCYMVKRIHQLGAPAVSP